ncbi:putative ankyrin repeat-containing protein [Trichoderma atroviride IMI 206040]|uniref:Ankyrin repeat-containing protein n=1 Tax=Hypocrea atroviridis (strain ATCC 20476 / IMI 206040) TaxID=452589 RepID=G9PA24_HYPAI|nr:putative ankyrin repeat-containing protein [Trichoderma atroviride IMI 206040]EHK40517.1 putative ankyrin repeat-containing protein [Trichoderma atroviride IMI 206040]
MLPERCISQINLHVSLADADHDGICRDNLHNPEMDRRRLIRVNGRRVPGTCEWIRDNVLYRSWLTCSQPSSDTALLWITGGPGMGKTMLSIFVIEELEARARQEQEPLVTLLFFFCSSNEADRNTAVAILSGLLFQLIEQHPGLAKHASYYLKPSHAASSLASFDTLWHIFERILGDVALQTVQCVLDGLDECGRESAGWLLTALEGQARSSPGRFRLLVLSRQMDGLEGFTRLRLDVNNDKPLASDIERCIADGVRRLSRLDGIASKVCDMLQAKSDGTFLWVGLILKELAKKKTSQEVWETIHSLPKGLNKIYSRILDQIQPQQQDESARLLRWVATAMRPLRLEELQELRGLAGCGDGPACLVSSLQACREQVVCCEGLLRIHDDAVHLVHQSARDYLLGVAKPFGIRPEEAHLELARHCLSCLEQSEAQSPSPLLDYATMYWPEHARQSKQHANKVLERSRPLFRDGSPLGLRWWQFWSRKITERDDLGRTLLHCAASGGHQDMVELLLRHRADANAKDGRGGTTLMWAAAQGHQGVTDLLIKHGVDVNAKDQRRQTALGKAARQGHLEIVRRLLHLGADVEAEDDRKQRPLGLAAEQGHEAVVEALLKRTPQVDNQDFWGQTALMRAAQRGHAAILICLLLDNGAEVDARSTPQQDTALIKAAEEGRESIVRLLLDRGADMDARDWAARTALMRAVDRDQEAVVRLLLERGADVNVNSWEEGTALMRAARRGNPAVVELLLASGADVDAKDQFRGHDALMAATTADHARVVQLLLDHGADANARGLRGEMALMAAAERGNDFTTRLLLSRGAAAGATDLDGTTALTRASQRGHRTVINLLSSAQSAEPSQWFDEKSKARLNLS